MLESKSFEHLFKDESGKLTASLLYIFGSSHLDQVENIVQDTLLKAMTNWPIHGRPKNPSAWLRKVSKNLAMDSFRAQARFINNQEKLLENYGDKQFENYDLSRLDQAIDKEIIDEQLRMIFLACHPTFSEEDRIILSLKMVAGLKVEEIASGFLMKKEAVAQRLVRLKRKIKVERINLIFPERDELSSRIDDVLSTIYLMFNEGYKTTSGNSLYNMSLCEESIRLINLILQHSLFDLPRVKALMALIMFQKSRLKSRSNGNYQTILLKDQDRSKWDWGLIELGFQYLNQAMTQETLSNYHLEAGIAACHSSAKNYEDTNWKQILSYYDILLRLDPSPITELNRIIAYAELHGVKNALPELKQLEINEKLESYYYLDATLANFHLRIGSNKIALDYYHKALKKIKNEVDRVFIENKIKELSS